MESMILQGDCLEKLKELEDQSIDCCVTSPPYYALRDYGIKEQIGHESTPEEYIQKLVNVFHEVKRVLKDDGTLWVNIGDSYWGSGSRGYDFTGKMTEASKVQANSKGTINLSNIPKLVGISTTGIKNKDLIGIPWMLAFALRKDGWYLRQDIIWSKKNTLPESVKDRCTKSHEYIFLLSKKAKYYFDHEAIQEEATGYDGRKDTLLKGSQKYADGSYMPNQNNQTMASKGHERWHFKNLQDKGQTTHTFHERRANGEKDKLYPVRNKRDVWSVATKPVKEAHYATFPEELITPCILAGSRKGG